MSESKRSSSCRFPSEALHELADEAAEDGEWKVDHETWDGTPYGVIRGGQGEIVVQEPVKFSAYASGAFITPARMDMTLESIAKMHNAFPGIVKAIADARAAGYAEAIEKAAQLVLDKTEGRIAIMEIGNHLADAIRTLTRA